MQRPLFFVTAMLLWAPASSAEPRTSLEATSSVAAEQDGCLEHAIKELGMSAKRVEGERRWNIGPQFLHPSLVPAGTLQVFLRKEQAASLIAVTANWPGAPKEKAVQEEIEERISSIATKMAQVCAVVRPTVRCVLTAPGAAPADCGKR